MTQTSLHTKPGFIRAMILVSLVLMTSCKVLRPGEPLKTTEHTELQLPTSYELTVEALCDTLASGKLRRISKKIDLGSIQAGLKFAQGNLQLQILTDSVKSREVIKEVPVIVRDTKMVYPWKLFALAFGAGVVLGLFFKLRLGGLKSLFK